MSVCVGITFIEERGYYKERKDRGISNREPLELKITFKHLSYIKGTISYFCASNQLSCAVSRFGGYAKIAVKYFG